MRASTLLSAAVLGLSTAALAQVATPSEQKVPANGAAADESSANNVSLPGDPAADPPVTADPAGQRNGAPARDDAATRQSGDPTAASGPPPK